MSATDCRQRAATAREHLAVARERLDVADTQPGPPEMAQVADSNAVLAAIAAADALCGDCSAEQDHRTTTTLLRQVAGADDLPAELQRLPADLTEAQ